MFVVRCSRHPSYDGSGLTNRLPGGRPCEGCDAVRRMRGAAFRETLPYLPPGATNRAVTIRWGAW